MSCAVTCNWVQAVLEGESPWVDVSSHLAECAECKALSDALDAVDSQFRDLAPPPLPDGLADRARDALFDARFAALAPPPVPPALVRSTLAAMDAEAPWKRPRWLIFAGGLLAAAAALAVAALPPPPADPGTLVEKGAGGSLPDVSLKVAVEQGGAVGRHDPRQVYRPGDILYFRASVSSSPGGKPATLSLVRIDAGGAEVIHQQTLPAGEADLALDGAPLGWRIAPGEGDAAFALLASPADLPRGQITAAMAENLADPCRAAAALPAGCASVAVEVEP